MIVEDVCVEDTWSVYGHHTKVSVDIFFAT